MLYLTKSLVWIKSNRFMKHPGHLSKVLTAYPWPSYAKIYSLIAISRKMLKCPANSEKYHNIGRNLFVNNILIKSLLSHSVSTLARQHWHGRVPSSIANSASFTFASFSNKLFVIVVLPPNKKRFFIGGIPLMWARNRSGLEKWFINKRKDAREENNFMENFWTLTTELSKTRRLKWSCQEKYCLPITHWLEGQDDSILPVDNSSIHRLSCPGLPPGSHEGEGSSPWRLY